MAGLPGTAGSSPSPIRPPGRTRPWPPPRKPPATAPRPPSLGPAASPADAPSAWISHDGPLPVIEGTLIRLQVDHLPGDRHPKPVWLWCSAAGVPPAEVDRCWQAFLRRFDLEHTFRLFKQVLGWTTPKIRDPAAADRWTWLIIVCHAQLWLARPLAADLRLPWERPAPPGRLTPARVRRGFRNIPRPAPPGQCAETRQTRPRPPARLKEPPPGTPLRRGKDHHKRTHAQGQARTRRLNDKLRACLNTQAARGWA